MPKQDAYTKELNQLLLDYQQTGQIQNESIGRIYRLRKSIEWLRDETIEESAALNNQLITHKLYLKDEINQLYRLERSKQETVQNERDKDNLRKQLQKHYKQHSLTSQVEALKEKESGKGKEPSKSGLKLILRIPKNDRIQKLKGEKKKLEKKSADKKSAKEVAIKSMRLKNTSPSVIQAKKVKSSESINNDEDNKRYCFCKQPSMGDMIACDNETSCCNGEWFHYKCVNLLSKAEASKYTTGKTPWFCSIECRETVNAEKKRQKLKQKRRGKS
ncbi:hypothetical protein KGF56_003954 [Candida oxycetoniae]|uniref:Zinc finger PHD-type domain-containing protein n=1 Tax=Candida oxycetoniae TaxID=497107 RepID=A0AAI9WWQ2_9ASCO|nr:uncharacterized protein KGF56_003954 [Candida oxycetoniae]KAI3403248.2 hypothetical protein KGF56_003954 [Candida oxycetoniae]